jgi:hypothetical protein
MNGENMRFTWRAVVLAPLAAPMLFSLAACGDAKSRVLGFLCFFLLGSFFSYGATMMLWLPSLFCLSLLTRLRFFKACLLGMFLGLVSYFPVAWVFWKSSGPDSGPPEITFVAYLARSLGEWSTWFFPVGGLITAIAWWMLSNQRPSQKAEAVAVG